MDWGSSRDGEDGDEHDDVDDAYTTAVAFTAATNDTTSALPTL